MTAPVRSRGRLRRHSWALWGVLSLGTALGMANKLRDPTLSRKVFLPGETSHGHYQIELECSVCHAEEFSAQGDFQAACVKCHADELAAAKDSHPESKFTDPRNAARTAQLETRYCVTCHSEHQPERTGTMGLSLPADYCYKCHEDIGSERASHKDLAFDSCASAGCHNFHDNRALYEDFLLKHGRDLPLMAPALILPIGAERCSSDLRAALSDETSVDSCKQCHAVQTSSWLSGRHGMRVAQELVPMKPGHARVPMHAEAGEKQMTCAACHEPEQAQNQEHSALVACESCHADDHTRAYRSSKHYSLFQSEQAGKVARGSGVTCATCHMPKTRSEEGEDFTLHNQNDNLRPNEKMIRSVCLNCHGLPFSLDALADPDLILRNFSGQPEKHVESVDFALARE